MKIRMDTIHIGFLKSQPPPYHTMFRELLQPRAMLDHSYNVHLQPHCVFNEKSFAKKVA